MIYGLDGEIYPLAFVIADFLILLGFYFYEKGQTHPLMPLALFKNKVRFGAYLVRTLFMMAMLPYWFLLPQVLQANYGSSALESGFAFLPLTITTFLTALQLPKLTKRFGNNRILFVGEIAFWWTNWLICYYGYDIEFLCQSWLDGRF